MVRTRIAPSPTGYPHIGTIYQALFDWAYAKKNKGSFILRVEDTDRERFVVDAEERIYKALDWFGLTEDESPRKGGEFGPYAQSQRLLLYKKYAEELIAKGHAYYCYCSKERLEEVRRKQAKDKRPMMYDQHCRKLKAKSEELKIGKPYVIRLKVPENEIIVVHDEIRGDVSFESNIVDDQVLLKTDGFPTYHLAVVVDDHLMKISHAVRGEEWLPSFPKHFLLYRFFQWESPKFYHTSALRNHDKSKLSKRQGHTNVSWYQEEGYLPEAILNYISLLGWSHPEEKEIFPLPEFIELFDLKDIRPVAPIFDLTKLTWMNQQYIQMKSDDGLKKLIQNFYPNSIEMDGKILDKLIPLVKTRMNTLKDFIVLTGHFFSAPEIVFRSALEKQVAKELYESLKELDGWGKDAIFGVFKSVIHKHEVRMPVLYYICTGSEKGLPLPESIEILGKEAIVNRLSKFI